MASHLACTQARKAASRSCKSHWGCRGSHPGHVGVPGGDQVVGHLVHGAGEVLQRLGPHQPVRKVHHIQDRRHCCRKDAVVVGHALHMEESWASATAGLSSPTPPSISTATRCAWVCQTSRLLWIAGGPLSDHTQTHSHDTYGKMESFAEVNGGGRAPWRSSGRASAGRPGSRGGCA